MLAALHTDKINTCNCPLSGHHNSYNTPSVPTGKMAGYSIFEFNQTMEQSHNTKEQIREWSPYRFSPDRVS